MTTAKNANAEGEEGILVAVRMRPMNKKESANVDESSSDSATAAKRVWRVLPSYNSVTQTLPTGAPMKEKVNGRTFFSFDKAFGEASSTRDVYDECSKPIVEDVTKGKNGTIFAYGQTSSGKTFTMAGSSPTIDAENPGVIHMAASDIFQTIADTPDRDFLLRVSFIEIYNEEVRDLLNKSEPLTIREDPKKGVYVESKENIVASFEQMLESLTEGEKMRSVGSTGMNERSSRSHTIFRITLESREATTTPAPTTPSSPSTTPTPSAALTEDTTVRVSTLNLVDLAGSESVRHTGAEGQRQKEGGKINQSLLTLSMVIQSLGQAASSNQHVHIKYRDSKLTRILQPSLSGNARMAVICCATPSELYLEETRSTLQFAARAKLVKTRAQVNEVMDDRAIIKKLQRELNEVKLLAGGNRAIKHLREVEKERDQKTADADANAAALQRLKDSIIKGGTLFSLTKDTSTVHPSLYTPAKTKTKSRRMTVAPKASSFDFGDSDDEFPIKPMNNRRQSVGTALANPRPSLVMSPDAPSALSSFVAVHQAADKKKSDRRMSTDSASSKSSASSESSRLSMSPDAGQKAAPSTELSLLKQALSAKGVQNKNLKSTVADLKEQLKKVVEERDSIGDECEEMIQENAKLSGTTKEENDRMQESIKMLAEELLSAKASIATQAQKINQTNFDVEAARDDNDDLLEDKKALEEANGELTEQVAKLTEANKEIGGLQELLQNSNIAIEEARETAVELETELESAKGDLDDALAMSEDYKTQAEEAIQAAKEENNEGLLSEIEALKNKLSVSDTLHSANIDELKEAFAKEKANVANGFEDATVALKKELKDMETDLTETQAREFELKQKAEDMTEQLSSAEAFSYELKNKLEDVTEQLETGELACNAARNAADEANQKVFDLNKEIKRLGLELEKAKAEGGEGEVDSDALIKLKEEMEKKDLRIKKLEAVRLTKEQCAALKKMKEERIKYMNRSKALEAQNAKLRSGGGGAGGDVVNEANVAEIARLKESNDLLGEKLRKYASHCQKLEGEKAAVIDTIAKAEANKDGEFDAEVDFTGSVASICERLSSAEEECDALASAETRANTYLTQLDRAKDERKKAVDDVEGLEEKVAVLTKQEMGMRAELKEVKGRAERLSEEKGVLADEKAIKENEINEVEGEKAKQVRFLEQENLQLMMETKNLKRSLGSMKAELDAYKGSLKSPLQERSLNVRSTPVSGKKGSVKKGSVKKGSVKKIPSARKVIAQLGEVGNIDEENTAECKQS